jgi:DNA-binding NarL/FixJ family response regulator
VTENNWTLEEAIEHLDARGTFGCGGCDDAWLYLKEYIKSQDATMTGMESLLADYLPRKPAPEIATLSARQREIADMIAVGMSDEAIASKLDLAYGTIKQHSYEIRHKLRVNTRIKVALLMAGVPVEQLS